MSRTRWQRKAPDFYWNKEQLAWVAGLVEGEGSIRSHKTRPSQAQDGVTYSYPSVRVDMTDEDVLRRAQEWTGLGNVIGPYTYGTRPSNKPFWSWKVQRKDEAVSLIAAIWPYLGQRRKGQARATLGAFKKGTRYVTN